MVGGGFMVLKPAASALGMTPQALITALESGQTISNLAAAKGLTVASLESTISTSIQSQLQALVTNGKLTQSQETRMYTRLEQNITSGKWIAQLQNVGKDGHRHQSAGHRARPSI
jgi:methionine-rich copper-binding protein CopC